MIEVVTGRNVWPSLHETYLDGDERKHAAIAYIGSRANDWLNLGPGDTLIFDGDDRSIKANHINLDVIGELMDLGVVLYSRSGLHAKVMVVESTKPVAIVGSANASVTLVESKAEAIVVTDDEGAVNEVLRAITEWQTGGDLLDRAWLHRVRRLDRDRSTPPSEYEPVTAVEVDLAKPMWQIDWCWTGGRYRSDAVEAAEEESETLGLWVEVMPVGDRQLFADISEGDSVLLVPYSSNRKYPDRRMGVNEPGLVKRKFRRGRYIFVAYGKDAIELPWGEAEDALEQAGSSWWTERQVDNIGKAAVIARFAQG